MNDSEAIASFRYRLREAARVALEIGDTLLVASQNAKAPLDAQLDQLRQMEGSLHCVQKYYLFGTGAARDATHG